MVYKPPSYKPPYKKYLETRQRRRRFYAPLIMGGLAILIFAAGLTLIWLWLNGSGIELSIFSTSVPSGTPSPTQSPPTNTPTITLTPSETPIPSETPTPTASAPFTYVVESGDTVSSLSEKFSVDYLIIMALNGLTDETARFLTVGDELIIPIPGMEFPTPTPLPANLRRGVIIEYFVMPGDSIRIIAEKFRSTIDAIIDENDLDNPNEIFPGQILLVPVYLVTPTFGPSPTPEVLPATETPTASPVIETSTASPTP